MQDAIITVEMRALGRAQSAAGAAFRAAPSPLTRAAYLNAIRRAVRHAHAANPAAIRFLDGVYREILDDIQQAAPPRGLE